jgi:arylsulfatase A-like enzyme
MADAVTPPRTVLSVMADQLRWNCLSRAGHPAMSTPDFDARAIRHVRLADAFVQGPVCGASRMSTYTERHVDSHGPAGNRPVRPA